MTTLTEREAFHAERQTGVFATDTWRIHPKGEAKPLTVYKEKRGEIPPWEGNKYTELGSAFEEGIAKLCEQDTGWTLRRCKTKRHRRHRWLGAHLDYIVEKGGKKDRAAQAVDCKFTARGRPGDGERGEAGTDQVPPRILCQLHHQIVAASLEVAHAFVVFGSTADRALYTVEPDAEWRDMILETTGKFWNDHVVPGVPPQPDASEFAIAYPQDKGTTLVLDPLDDLLVMERERLKAQAKEIEETLEDYDTRLKMMAQDHRWVATSDGIVRLDYRTVNPRTPDAGKTLKALAAAEPEKYAEILAAYGTPRDSYRALFPKKVKT